MAWFDLRAISDVQRRFETMQRRMAPGSLGGRTESASPVSPAARGIATPATRPTGAGLAFMDAFIDDTGTAYSTNAWHDVPIDVGNSYGEGDAFEALSTGVKLLKPGVVQVSVSVPFEGNATGVRGIKILEPQGSNHTVFGATIDAAYSPSVSCTYLLQVTSASVGNQFKVQIWQSSGGGLGLFGDGWLDLVLVKVWS